MKTNEIRKKYIEFFVSKSHAHIKSASLVPKDDPTVLFTTAGMHPLVPYFLGKPHPNGRRIVDFQKCLRTGDIEEVGDDTHLTFFEMLGNWSLGDYFKNEAIQMSYEFLTDVKWLGIPHKKLAVTVFKGDNDAPRDDEAAEIWKSLGFTEDKICYLPKSENWWGPAGETGPCGPDSEMFYYRGEGLPSIESNPETDEENWVEIWNDVFMQYNKNMDGTYELLAQKNVDTGMGLERIAAVLQGKNNVFETDVFMDFITLISKTLNQEYTDTTKRSIRIIADHLRASTFIIADGIEPSNMKRGYVLRRLLRRSIASAHLLGATEPILHIFAEYIITNYGDVYPELKRNKKHIMKTISKEENTFLQTLQRGLKELQKMLDRNEGISGHDAFLLHDTYGFPIDLTVEFTNTHGISVDRNGFEKELEAQRVRSRIGSGFTLGKSLEKDYEKTDVTLFVGYESMEIETTLLHIKGEGDNTQIVLKSTPFYAESGGQAGDMGIIQGNNGRFVVKTTKKTKRNVFVHIGTLEGTLSEGETVTASVDIPSRMQNMKYHTATHLLHLALKQVLGGHVNQRGSSITPKRLRFDFSHDRSLTPEELKIIEEKINTWITDGYPVKVIETTLEKAKVMGTTALFEDKYGSNVRLIDIGNGLSRELCGGTHVSNTSEIGKIIIKKQKAVAGGIRRLRLI